MTGSTVAPNLVTVQLRTDSPSDAEGPGLRDAPMRRRHVQRLDGAGLVEPDVGIELAGELDAGIVALHLGVGPVDHANEALQPVLTELRLERLAQLPRHQ